MYRPRINYKAMSLAVAERDGGSFMSKCRIASLALTLEANSKKRREYNEIGEIRKSYNDGSIAKNAKT